MTATAAASATGKDSDESTEKQFVGYRSARLLLITAMVGGLLLPIIYAFQAPTLAQSVSSATVGVGTVAACLAVGGLLGFVFGIPRQLQEGLPPPRTDAEPIAAANDRPPAYASNTSLEQISDWLTKILVGVGLTQLANIPTALVSIGTFVSAGLGGLPGAEVFATGLVVFGLLDGFFLAYIWTRLYLPSLLTESELRAAKQQYLEIGVEIGVVEGVKTGRDQSVEAEKRAIAAVSRLTIAGPTKRGDAAEKLRALWVDDSPSGNKSEMSWIQRQIPIEWQTASSTEEAMADLTAEPRAFAFVITNMGRPGDAKAGYTLLKQMRDADIGVPVIVYSASGDPKYDEEARRNGALGSTNSPSRLLELVTQALQAE